MEHNCHAKQQHQMQSDPETISQTIKIQETRFRKLSHICYVILTPQILLVAHNLSQGTSTLSFFNFNHSLTDDYETDSNKLM